MYIHCNWWSDLATHAVLVDNWLRIGNAVLYCRGIRGAVEFGSGSNLEASGRM
jgi:hypothetical protein